MRVRIASLALEGTRRRVMFTPGLNVITGPIATGKTTLLRFARALLGAPPEHLPHEARSAVTGILGEIILGSRSYSIMRPSVTTRTARVDLAGDGEALRLPVVQAEREGELTYVRWLLDRLDLPRLEVPSAPTKPESEPTPISLNDYLLYCTITQEELGFSVFGHQDPFKNIKRKYVFEIVYGIYNIETAQLQDEFRDVQSTLRELRSQHELFSKFLANTALENRAEIERELELARTTLRRVEGDISDVGARGATSGKTADLQKIVLRGEAEVAQLEADLEAEQQAMRNMERLCADLEAQVARITRSIVAQKYLLDIEFVICPRCGSSLEQARGEDERCYLCLQTPQANIPRETLVNEQARIEAQISEARELLLSRKTRSDVLKNKLAQAVSDLRQAREELDFLTRTFVSTEASRIAALAAHRAEVRSRVSQLTEYLKVHERLDEAQRLTNELTTRKEELEQALDAATGLAAEIQRRLDHLTREFNIILERFHPPAFGEERSASIDRRTFLPIYYGRRFDDLLSPGLGTLVTIAYALAHQRTAIALDLKLPNILFIDGLSEHLGQEGLDPERVRAIYEYLIETSGEIGDALQMIVVDNEVPAVARPFVRLELSDSDRLIPQPVG